MENLAYKAYDVRRNKGVNVITKHTMTSDVEFWAKLCAIEVRLSVLEKLLLRLYELMRHHYPPPIR